VGSSNLLSISIVTYHPDPAQFILMLGSLDRAVKTCTEGMPGFSTEITIVDNANQQALLEQLIAQAQIDQKINIIANKSNTGFGRAHNQVIRNTASEFHLILNPDVIFYSDALLNGLRHLQNFPQCVAVSPEVRGADGRYQYLCKSYPSVLDLALRGFAPEKLKHLFKNRLSRYENRVLVEGRVTVAVSIISGCFMLCPTQQLKNAGGFNEAFFLYFEDYALSLELGKSGQLEYVPEVRIIHYGGKAGSKGWRHVGYFIGSAFRFFSLYGWKWL
jgi:GT2 family glycosyltransferase